MTTVPADMLKKSLADIYALLLKTHNFHWNVTGHNFCDLHRLFEEQYKSLLDSADIIAERIRALGDHAPGGLRAFAATTIVEEAPKNQIDADTMLALLTEDHSRLADRSQHGIEIALNIRDNVTADLLTKQQQYHEKQIWIMKAIKLEKHITEHKSAVA